MTINNIIYQEECENSKVTKSKISWEQEANKPILNSENNNWQDVLLGNTDQETLKKVLGDEYNNYLKTVDQYSEGTPTILSGDYEST